MGAVYRAHDEEQSRDVAIKIIHAGLESDPDARRRFLREGKILSQLVHRNVVRVLELGEEVDRPFIVMELLKGNTLSKAVHEPQLQGLEAKLDLMIQGCEGLSKAHAAGVIHRDVKPSNLFVLGDGSLKILDFGIARLASSTMTRTGLVVGTPDYMSPEQARGVEIDERSDLFSAAAVFYFLLTGRKPFEGPDLAGVMLRVMREDPAPIPPDEAPAPLARIIFRALKKDPDFRYQRCADLAADLIRFKRNFDTETREMGSAIRAQFADMCRVADGIQSLSQQLGAEPNLAVAEQRASLSAKYPYLVPADPGSTPVMIPIRRSRIQAIQTDLSAVLDPMKSQLRRLEAQVSERKHRIEMLVTHIESATGAGEFERAAGLLRDLRAVESDTAPGDLLERQLDSARLAAEIMARVRTTYATGAWGEAIDQLEAAVRQHPHLSVLAAELVQLRVEAHRASASAARQAELMAHVRDAELLLEGGDRIGAKQAAERALVIDAAQPTALRIHRHVQAQLHEEADAADRRQRARPVVSRAIRHLAAGEFAEATKDAQAALSLDPGHPDAARVASESLRLAEAADVMRRRLAAARAREHDVQVILTGAEEALRSGEFERAVHDAKRALDLDPVSGEAQEVLERAETVLSFAPPDTNDTQELIVEAAEAPPPDSPDRVSEMASKAKSVLKTWANRVPNLGRRPRQ